MRASALNRLGGANSLGPVAPSPKPRCVSNVGTEAPQRITKTRLLHASLERHAFPSFHQQREVVRKRIRNKSLELARSQNEHDKSGRLFACFVKDLNPKPSMFYNDEWYIDHNELIYQDWKCSHTEIKGYEPLFHKRKRTHALVIQSSLFLSICCHSIHHI